jgi:hypothetical protein
MPGGRKAVETIMGDAKRRKQAGEYPRGEVRAPSLYEAIMQCSCQQCGATSTRDVEECRSELPDVMREAHAMVLAEGNQHLHVKCAGCGNPAFVWRDVEGGTMECDLVGVHLHVMHR